MLYKTLYKMLLLNCLQETDILCYRVLENLRTKALKMLTLIVQEFDHPPSERWGLKITFVKKMLCAYIICFFP